jgi:hypothetical protein
LRCVRVVGVYAPLGNRESHAIGNATTVPDFPSTCTLVPADVKSRCTYPSATGPNRVDVAALVTKPIFRSPLKISADGPDKARPT